VPLAWRAARVRLPLPSPPRPPTGLSRRPYDRPRAPLHRVPRCCPSPSPRPPLRLRHRRTSPAPPHPDPLALPSSRLARPASYHVYVIYLCIHTNFYFFAPRPPPLRRLAHDVPPSLPPCRPTCRPACCGGASQQAGGPRCPTRATRTPRARRTRPCCAWSCRHGPEGGGVSSTRVAPRISRSALRRALPAERPHAGRWAARADLAPTRASVARSCTRGWA
jgi:hypothetical protein